MRSILLPCACCVVVACATPQPTPLVDEPRQITLAESSQCRKLGMIVKRSVRHSNEAFNTEQAMRDAMDAVLASGADAYQLLDVDDESRGTQVIMQAFDCRTVENQ